MTIAAARFLDCHGMDSSGMNAIHLLSTEICDPRGHRPGRRPQTKNLATDTTRPPLKDPWTD